MMQRQDRPRRMTTLGWISLLLLMSAALRLGAFTGMAHALDSGGGIDDGSGIVTNDPSDPVADTATILEAFQAREMRIGTRETRVAEREEALIQASFEIERRLVALQEAEDTLATMIALAESAASSDLQRLTAVYENMRPQEAAALFENMDPAFSAGFMGMMDPAAGAAIMGRLSPQVAYSISAVLAGRNSAAPSE